MNPAPIASSSLESALSCSFRWPRPIRNLSFVIRSYARIASCRRQRQRIFNFSAGPAVLPFRCSKRRSAIWCRFPASACRCWRSAIARRPSTRSSRRPKPTCASSAGARRLSRAVPAGRRQPAVLDGADEPAAAGRHRRLHRHRRVGGESGQGGEARRHRAHRRRRPKPATSRACRGRTSSRSRPTRPTCT